MKILVATDFSENAANAFRFALQLAKTQHGILTLIFAYSPVYDFAAQTAEFVTCIEEQASKALKDLCKSSQKEGVPCAYLIKQTTASSAICAEAENNHYDLIVLGSQGENSISKKIFGSTSTETIRMSKKPVLTVPANANFNKLSSISLAMELIREDIIFVGQLLSLTKAYRLPYRIIHINKGNAPISGELDFSELSSYLNDRFPELNINYLELEAKEVNEGLRHFTEQYPQTILAMFSRHHGFFDYLFRTSHCAEMALNSSVPLLILKPPKR